MTNEANSTQASINSAKSDNWVQNDLGFTYEICTKFEIIVFCDIASGEIRRFEMQMNEEEFFFAHSVQKSIARKFNLISYFIVNIKIRQIKWW